MRSSILAILLLFFSLSFSETADERLEQRIQAVGKVPVQEELVKNSESNSAVGKKVYEHFCIVCHRDGLLGAPKFHDEQAWKSRLSDRTLQELVVSAVNGLNAMPAKGTCYECNEEDIKSAVEYMLPHHD